MEPKSSADIPLEYVPGTAHLVDIENTLNVKKNNHSKHNADIVLIPQPSSSPRDPLNWSPRRKYLHLYLLLFWGFLVALNVAFLAPAYNYLVVDLDTNITQVIDSSALTYVFLGVGCVLLQPTAMKFGRRATYLFASVLELVSLIVGGTAQNISLLYAFNAISGFGAAPVDSLVQVSTTDIFFQHERGNKLSAFIFVIYAGSYLGPIFTGYFAEMDDGVGWRWSFWLCLLLQGTFFIFQIFLMEDSTFRRSDEQLHVEENILRQITTELLLHSDGKDLAEVQVEPLESPSSEIKPIPYRERLKLLNLEHNDPRPWLVIALRPLLCLSFPSVVFGGILYGLQILFLSLTANTQTTVFTSAPYHFRSTLVGLTNISSLVGSCIGMVWGGKVADYVTVYLARRNRGIVEPEMRLYAMSVPTIITAAGLLMYGLGAHYGVHWFVPAGLGMAFISIGICSSGPIVITYAIDCYPALASESVVLILFMRNMIGCGFTFGVSPWLEKVGLKNFTWTVFAISVVVNGSSVWMIMFGKGCRRRSVKLYERFQDRSRVF